MPVLDHINNADEQPRERKDQERKHAEQKLKETETRLTTIIDKFKGGPVGLTTIATAIGENAGTLEEVYEPFLIQEGFLMRTPRGRQATERAYTHLGKDKGWSQGGLF